MSPATDVSSALAAPTATHDASSAATSISGTNTVPETNDKLGTRKRRTNSEMNDLKEKFYKLAEETGLDHLALGKLLGIRADLAKRWYYDYLIDVKKGIGDSFRPSFHLRAELLKKLKEEFGRTALVTIEKIASDTITLRRVAS